MRPPTRSRTRLVSAGDIPILLASVLAACEPVAEPPHEPTHDVSLEVVLASNRLESDGSRTAGVPLFAQLAAEIPGFGGLYRQARCTVVVVLTDPSQEVHAKEVVSLTLRRVMSAACEGITVTVALGDFTYVHLVRMLAAARPLHQMRGVLGTHIDFWQNRLVVVLASADVIPNVQRALARLGIPESAVLFKPAPGIRPRG